MPLSTRDPTPALVVIDLQKGIVFDTVAHAVPHAVSLAKSFRQHELPVVLVNVTGRAPGRTDPGSHRHSLERVFPKLGESATSAEIIDFLDRDARL